MRYTLQRSIRSNRFHALRWDGFTCTGIHGPIDEDAVYAITRDPYTLTSLSYDDGNHAGTSLWESPIVAYDDDIGMDIPPHPIYRQLFTGDLATMQTVQRAIDAAMPHVSPLDCIVLLTRDPSMAGWTIVGQPPTATAMARVESAAFDIAERTSA